MIDNGEAISDYPLYKGKLAPYTPPHSPPIMLQDDSLKIWGLSEILDAEW